MLSFCVALVFCYVGAAPLSAQGPGCGGPSPLSRPIKRFKTARVSIAEALLQFGQENQVCLGVESVRPDLFTRPVELEIENTAVRAVLDRLLAPVKAYSVSEQGRLILIRDAEPPGQRTWLDYKMSSFRAPREPVHSASTALHMWLRSQSDPSIKGFAGDSPGGDLDNLTGPFDAHDDTVRESLTLIVSGSNGGMWVAQGPDILRSRGLGSRPFWKILEYSQPMQLNLDLINAMAAQAHD